ncbi:MAG: hypothetical protein JST92_00645 [Deltaproteobacteria bacterium]|nr:hypothetical protein [Deltaproteobacteria bacterium]
MPDDVDDLILKMQHLEAAAKAERDAHARSGWAERMKSKAQKMAAEAQAEVTAAEAAEADGAAKVAKAKTPGLPPLEAADLFTSGRQQVLDSKTRIVKARARLNFALDQMDEAERAEYESLRAAAMAEAHTQLADSGDDGAHPTGIPGTSGTPDASAAAAPAATPAPATSLSKPTGPALPGLGPDDDYQP